jgi:hypothetical protein
MQALLKAAFNIPPQNEILNSREKKEKLDVEDGAVQNN